MTDNLTRLKEIAHLLSLTKRQEENRLQRLVTKQRAHQEMAENAETIAHTPYTHDDSDRMEAAFSWRLSQGAKARHETAHAASLNQPIAVQRAALRVALQRELAIDALVAEETHVVRLATQEREETELDALMRLQRVKKATKNV